MNGLVFDQVALHKIKAILKHSVYNKMDIAYLRRIGAEVIIYYQSNKFIREFFQSHN